MHNTSNSVIHPATGHTAIHNNRIPTYFPYFVWGLGCAFYFYEFILQISPNVMTKDLMREFSITAQSLGIFSGVWFWSYSLMQVPAGILLDRFGPQRILTFAVAICSLGALTFGLAPNLTTATLARFFIGFGSAFAVIGTFKLAANWFPPNRFALLAGATVALGMTGAIFAEGPLSLLIDAINWRNSMILFGVLGLLLTVLLKIMVRDTPAAWIAQKDGTPEHKPAHTTQKTSTAGAIAAPFIDLWVIIQHKQIWLLAIYAGLMYFPTLTFCGLWGTDFLSELYGLQRASASGIVSLVFVGWIVGAPLSGWYSDRIRRRLPPMYIGCIGALATMLTILYIPVSLTMMGILLFLFGLFSSGFMPAFSVVKESSPPHQTATALGFMNMMNMIGAAFIQPLVGYILDRVWSGEMVNNTPHYSLGDFQIALSVMPIGLMLALITLPYIRETFCGSAISSKK